jgi:hypothetical protein
MVDDNIVVRAKIAASGPILLTELTRYADAFPGSSCSTGNTAWKIPGGFYERAFPVVLLARVAFCSCCCANAIVNASGHAGVALFFLSLSLGVERAYCRGERADALPFNAGVAF